MSTTEREREYLARVQSIVLRSDRLDRSEVEQWIMFDLLKIEHNSLLIILFSIAFKAIENRMNANVSVRITNRHARGVCTPTPQNEHARKLYSHIISEHAHFFHARFLFTACSDILRATSKPLLS